MTRRGLNGVIAVMTLLYPLAVYLGSNYLQPRYIAWVLISLLSFRFATSLITKHWSSPIWLGAILFCSFAAWTNELNTLRLYPVLVNASMLLIFGYSLLFPPSLVERFARLQEPELPQAGVLYTRRVTQVWCVFFC